MPNLTPKYTVSQGVMAALALATRALEEIRLLARQPGPRGADGLGWDDMSEELADDGRTIVRRYKRGDQVKEFRHTFAVLLDKGVFRDGEKYMKGDCVTWAGSLFIAQKDAAEGRPEVSQDWRLAVKRGRDGKEVVSIARDPSKVVKI